MAGEADRGHRVDLMGEESFPASDPPAAWTWECNPTAEAEPKDGAAEADPTAD